MTARRPLDSRDLHPAFRQYLAQFLPPSSLHVAQARQSESGSVAPAVRQTMRRYLQPVEPAPLPPPPMSRLEMAGAIAFAAVALGAKWLQERSRMAVTAVETPPTALVPVVGQTPGTSSWTPILAFLAPLAVGVGVWAARLWGAHAR